MKRMKKRYVVVAGYGAAIAGTILYMVTGETTGVVMGGIFLCVTSLYKIVLDKKEGK